MATVKAFAFSDGSTANAGAGHQIDLGSGLSTGQVDMIGVVSNATVTTPSGWVISPSNNDVAVAAMYVYRRTTGASGLVSIKTAADHPTTIIHVRLAGVASVDDAKKQVVSGVAAASSPTVTSATLLASGEAVVAFALLHNWATAPTGVTWSGSFTGLDTDAGTQLVTQTDATASRRVGIAAAVHLNAGTTAVATAATWTNNATNRGTMLLSWQATVPGTITVVGAGASVDGVLAAPVGPLSGSLSGTREVQGVAAASLGGVTAALAGSRDVSGVLGVQLGPLTAALTGTREVGGTATGSLGPLIAVMAGTREVPGVLAVVLGPLAAEMTTVRAIGPHRPIVSQTTEHLIVSQTREVRL